MLTDTIAAIVTPPGEGGVGIIRISGPCAVSIGLSLYRTPSHHLLSNPTSHKAYFGCFIDPQTNDILDQGLFLPMLAPKSYTGEDVIELQVHGGALILERLLSKVLSLGARLAYPGEFTRRAFLNGKLDLTQAEAVIDLIRAKTEGSRRSAIYQLEGKLRQKVQGMRVSLIRLLARLEAQIDFPEEIEELSLLELKKILNDIRQQVRELLETANSGKILRQGISLAIVGRPNVGKSSLLNALLEEDRAIVAEIPGTTRDIIEEYLNIRGIPIRIVDTAGIRETFDRVEQLGIQRTRQAVEEAEVVLLVISAVEGLTEDDRKIIAMAQDKERILVINKRDERPDFPFPELDLPMVAISAKQHQGLQELEEAIYKSIIRKNQALERQEISISARHQASLEEVAGSLCRVLDSIEKHMPTDFLTIDLKQAILSLGEITGETVTEEVIERIFADFCVGK